MEEQKAREEGGRAAGRRDRAMTRTRQGLRRMVGRLRQPPERRVTEENETERGACVSEGERPGELWESGTAIALETLSHRSLPGSSQSPAADSVTPPQRRVSGPFREPGTCDTPRPHLGRTTDAFTTGAGKAHRGLDMG